MIPAAQTIQPVSMDSPHPEILLDIEKGITHFMNDNIWNVRKSNEWHKRQPWWVGCNFIPSTAINQLEMWQAGTYDPSTIEKELAGQNLWGSMRCACTSMISCGVTTEEDS